MKNQICFFVILLITCSSLMAQSPWVRNGSTITFFGENVEIASTGNTWNTVAGITLKATEIPPFGDRQITNQANIKINSSFGQFSGILEINSDGPISLNPGGKNVGVGTLYPDKVFSVRGSGDSGNYPRSDMPLNHSSWQGEFGKEAFGRVLLGTFADQPAIQGHGTGTSYRLLLNPYGGYIGLGTTDPKGPLHIQTYGSPPASLATEDNGLLLGTTGPGTYKWIQSYGGILNLNPKGNDVQIGSGRFGSNLVVNGSTRTRVLTITGGADIAEPFVISRSENDEILPGAVVAIDENVPGKLTLSQVAFDKKVAGVISGANGVHPGLVLNQEEVFEKGENVALSGRVYVRANNSNGNIEPGDFLTTSSIPGEAMKVTDMTRAQGAIIGKAMTGLNSEKGFVLILITLQ